MKHIEWKCQLGWQKCTQCNYDTHPELFTCAICDASEGELTTECPGKKVSYEMRELTYQGAIDFKGGQWVKLRPLKENEEKVFNQ